MSVEQVWAAARAAVEREIGPVRAQPWIEELALRSCEPSGAVLEAGSGPARESASKFLPQISDALTDVLGRQVHVRVVVRRSRGRPAAERPRPEAAASSARDDEGAPLAPDRVNASFELSSFLTGPSNELPLRFARDVLEQPGKWCPVVFYGGSGSGKTHLLQAIANGYRRRYPGRRVVYASSERFARQFAVLAQKRQGGRFRELYREADLLVLDDVHDLAGKEKTERELIFTLDHLSLNRRQVVMSTSCFPGRVQFDRSLGDRLVGGQTVELKQPDRPTRLSIIKARTAALSLSLDDAVLELLTSGLESNVRELLCALTQLDAHRRHVNARLDLASVRQILAEMLRGKSEPASLAGISAFVATRLSVDDEQLRSGSRRPRVARARQVAMALGRELTGLTLREVGTFFGQRSCASVHAAQQKVASLRAEDAATREVWDAACARFMPERSVKS